MRRPLACLALAMSLSFAGAATARSPARVPAATPGVGSPSKPQTPPAGPPKLVVAISVDQLAADLFARYRRHFVSGLARLQDGAVYPSGFQSHAATETCPGHSTLLTGARPARTGIIANSWFDPAIARADKRIYCAEDERDPSSTSREPVVSAWHLKVPTLGEWMKRANPESRNVAVSGKDRAVVMMGGHVIDAAYWWKGSGFTSFADRPISPAATRVNAAAAATIKAGAPAFALPAFCAATDQAVPVKDFTLGTGRFALMPGKADGWRLSPRLDAATGDLALRLVDEMQLGKRAAPDLLAVSFSATDYVGHAFGNGGSEMCIQMAELDKSIGRLLAALDARRIDYVVVLSADHGGIDAPERLDRQGYPAAARADKALNPGELAREITQQTGISAPAGPLLFGDGPSGDYYLASGLSPDQKRAVVAALIARLKSDPEVAAVYTAAQLAGAPMPVGSPQDWTLLERARASFDPERSGDVVSFLKRGVVGVTDPSPSYTATHGSIWDYDRRVPILFWRRGLSGFEQPTPVETVDIAPTLAAVLGLSVPAGSFDGHCLDIDGGPGDTCGAGR